MPMRTQLIELKDGLLVEVETPTDEAPKQIAARAAERVEGAMDAAEQVEIELALGFEAEGNLFLVKGTGNANISFKLTVKPK
jgi:predicted regulator of Ras-like GTPase activity (Roadblock/LC7/MglB family)